MTLPRPSRCAPLAAVSGEVNRSARAEGGETRNAPSTGVPSPIAIWDLFAYQRDRERAILFGDTLRQRADNMLAHERAGKPPLLDFDYELALDARRLGEGEQAQLLAVSAAEIDRRDGGRWA